MRAKQLDSKLLRRLASGLLLLGVLLRGAPLAAQTTTSYLTVSNPNVVPGTGNAIVKNLLPQLQGQNAGPLIEQFLNSSIAQFSTQLVNQVNSTVNSLDIGNFLGYSANATAGATRALGLDYGTDASIFSLSLGVSGAVNNWSSAQISELQNFGSNLTQGSLPSLGANVGAVLALGINLGAFPLPRSGLFDWRRVSVFVDFVTLHHQQTASGSGLQAPINFNYTHAGLLAQYRLLSQKAWLPAGLLRWGGLAVATGAHYATSKISTAATLPPTTVSTTVSFETHTLAMDLLWNGTADLTAQLNALVIPLEASTHFQLLYVLTLFSAVGIDLNFATSSLQASSAEPVTVTLRQVQTGQTQEVANPAAQFNLSAMHQPTVWTAHALLGLQLNFGVLAPFVQAEVDTANNIAAATGLRAFW